VSFFDYLRRGRRRESVPAIVPEQEPEAVALETVSSLYQEKHFLRKKVNPVNMNRLCRVEELERRELLAVDTSITLGGVILEQNEDIEMGDRFYLSWVTDVSDASLAMQQVTFELGYSDGGTYAFFDTTEVEPNGGNYDTGHQKLSISPQSDIRLGDFDYYFTYADGRTDTVGDGAISLTILFHNNVFTAGKKLVFEVDVDFCNTVDGETYFTKSNFEGIEMEYAGVNFSALFTADQYESLDTTLFYKDVYSIDGRLDIVDDICDDPFTDGGLNTTGVVETLPLTPKPVDLSGYVYADVVWDCYYRPSDGDYALSNVELSLYTLNEDGRFVQYYKDGRALTTQTDADGYYEFSDLLPGTYQIVCDSDIYYGELYGNDIYYHDKCARAQNHPVSPDPLVLTTEELVGGSSSVQNNFGKVLWGTIAGNVYEDRNLNGSFDDGDIGIAGVSVELYKLVDGVYVLDRSTKTASDGSYYFLNLERNATYALHETQPSGYYDAENTAGYVKNESDVRGEVVYDARFAADRRVIEGITIAPFENGVENNFGEVKLFSVSGYVYEDLDFSKTRSTGDANIAGVTIELYKEVGATLTLVGTATTDRLGYYEFTDLALNEVYYIHEVQPSRYLNATNNIGTISGAVYGTIETLESYGDDVRTFVIDLTARQGYGWNESGVQYNFGENRVDISGYVYEDRDSSDTFSVGDKGIANTRVELYKKVGSQMVYITSTDTDAAGYYEFKNLDVDGEYYIHEVQPDGYVNKTNTVGSFNDKTLGSIVSMTDYGDDVRIFDVDLGGADKSEWVPGETGVHYNFGETIHGSISGYVYQDRDDSGTKTSKDAPIENVTIELYKWNGEKYVYVTETKTDAAGYYTFDHLDINEEYAVHEVQPSEYENRSNNIGSVNGTTTGKLVDSEMADDARIFEEIGLTWEGNSGVQYNFGEIKYGSISGYVYDVTTGQTPISGVTITLTMGDGSTATRVTDANGYYIFDGLTANKTYTVTEQDLSAVYTHYGESVGNFSGETIGQKATRVLSMITIPWDDLHNEPGDQDGVLYNFYEYVPTPDPEPKEDPWGYNLGQEIPLILPQRYYGGPTSPFNYLPDGVSPAPVTEVRYGGGGLTPGYAWHLSVLNGGYPRSIEGYTSVAGYRGLYGREPYALVSLTASEMNRGEWIILGTNGDLKRYVIGADEAIAVAGDWNGDGADEIGFYVNGLWYLDLNGNGKWDDEDLWAELGGKLKDQPVTGDWDGDGKSDIGIFGPRWEGDELAVNLEAGLPAAKNKNTFQNVSRPKNVPPEYNEVNVKVRTLRQSTVGDVRVDLIDHVFEYGHEGDVAVTGDWNGDGISKIGVYNDGTWRLDVNGDGQWNDGDVEINGFGGKESIPVVGDFNGDGIDEIGLFENGHWSIDTTGDHKPDKSFEFGRAGDQPLVGDWNGDGTAEFSVYRSRNASVEADTISTDI
jgi:serine-aspartate repeat-containing protein C/D/E